MKTLTKYANAKINFGLQILNKREDGFHNINSLFLPISLSDTLNIEESDDYTISCSNDLSIAPENNIALIAAKMINDFTGNKQKVSIHIEKNIPIGAGLGGGSSDAASVLLGMNEIFSLGLSYEELSRLALSIGSDVPFFIYNKAAIAKGQGELLDFKDFSINDYLLLVYPNIAVSTKEAYISLERSNEIIDEFDFYSALNSHDKYQWQKYIYNDFEDFCFRKHPEIRAVKEELLRNGSFFALMSGSGSSVFGLFDGKSKAEEAQKVFKKYRTFICNII